MSIYKKRISVGQFLKKGEDYKDGDIVTVANEGKEVESKFGSQDVFLVKLNDGREGNVSFNTTTINHMIDVFGDDSKNWIGKDVKVWAIRSNVQGKMINVYYFSHPDAILSDSGEFVLPVAGKVRVEEEEIPIIEDDPNMDEQIPF